MTSAKKKEQQLAPEAAVPIPEVQGVEEKSHSLPEKTVIEKSPTGSEVAISDVTSHINENNHGSDRLDLERTVTQKPPIVKVPRKDRRGLFARFALVPEVTEPKHYDDGVKWFITFVVAIAAAAAPIGSAIIFPTLVEVTVQLNTTPTVTNLSVALYMLSMAIFPLWWSAFSETVGRRSIYLVSFALFIVASILSAVSTNIAMLVVFRMVAGGAAASVQAVGAGTIADVWEPVQRGKAMGWFYLGPLCGPLVAPVIGGVLGQHLGWRATQYAMAVYGLLTWIFIFFALPETLKTTRNYFQQAEQSVVNTRPPLSRTTTRESVKNQSLKWVTVAKMLFLDPLKVVKYLRFPAVLITVYYASVTFGSLYVLNISIQYTFEKAPYNFSTLVVGLLYLPNSLGYMLASIFGGRWMDAIMAREAVKANRVTPEGKLIYRPEDRMRENAWLGALLYPAALIWYGWTADKGVYWLVPMVANFFYGVRSMLIFAMATTMLTEFMPRKSSSGVALNNLMRNTFSCVGGIVGAPLIASIGNGWLFTILGLWALSSCMVIWAMRRFGPRWRENMDKQLQ